MNNWKIIFATMVIFGAGVLTGGALVKCVQHCSGRGGREKPAMIAEGSVPTNYPPAHPMENSKPRPPEILSKQFLKRLDEELRLTPVQHAEVQKIISEGQNQVRKVLQDQRLEIREVLTPEQRKQFDELVKHPFRHPIFGTNSTVVVPSPTNAAPAATNAP